MDNIVFGIRPVIEAIESGRQIEKVYVRKGAEGQLLSELKSVCKAQKVHMQEVPTEKLNRMTKLNHQGVVATVSPIVYADVEEILSGVPEGEAGLIVLLDSITDVRNFGAIARSAECVGAHGLITSLKSSAPVNAEAIKSSAGALNIIPVARVGSIRNTLKALQAEGYQIAAATEKAEQTVYEADLTRPTVLVMGSEDTGISKEVLKMCDCQMAIPMKGRIESLNVSAAAAVILFEIQRQRISK
ncbi:MAG: 23S rRNA (guanosine(2251)-2'-O)-methyltransferase RlmB [Rikenellaceae bacterium]|nr:23S rRNA (guanosine(2251)-2'-O)-methyltransferase RlmB [Rikenellaceae bacterium]